MKRCELCKSSATIYCDSDQASLCWTCDAKVHSANFLVARHSRCLLCHSCQSPTQWSASGEKLEPSTVSICETCVVEGISDDDVIGTDDDEEYDGDEDEEETGSDGREVRDHNQVVPWSCKTPPPAPSSSSSVEFPIAGRGGSVKRHRQNVPDLSSEDEINCSSVQRNHRTRTSTVAETATGGNEAAQIQSLPSRSEAIMEKLDRNRKRNMISDENEYAAVAGKSKSMRVFGFDLNSAGSSS